MFSIEKGTLTRGYNMSNLDSSIKREINNTEGCMITATHDGIPEFLIESSRLSLVSKKESYPSLDPDHVYTAAHQQRFQGLAIAVHHRRSFRRLQHRCLAHKNSGKRETKCISWWAPFFRRRTNPFMAWIWDSGPSIFALFYKIRDFLVHSVCSKLSPKSICENNISSFTFILERHLMFPNSGDHWLPKSFISLGPQSNTWNLGEGRTFAVVVYFPSL